MSFQLSLVARVSTHSRLKAAGLTVALTLFLDGVSTHSRLKAAGRHVRHRRNLGAVSTHSRLKAAGAARAAS